jgi:signal transduction histidine kinase
MSDLHEHERLLVFETLCSLLRHDVRNKVAAARMAAHWLRKKGTAAGLTSEPRFEQFHGVLDSELIAIDALLTERLPITGSNTAVSSVALQVVVDRALFELPIPAGMRVDVNAGGDRVRGIVDDLACALRALLRNAFEAQGETGVARVRCYVDDGAVFFEVSDDGPGIPESVRSRAAHGFTSTKGGHVGLGLAVVARVARAHVGELVIAPAQPTRVAFRLPT